MTARASLAGGPGAVSGLVVAAEGLREFVLSVPDDAAAGRLVAAAGSPYEDLRP